MAVAIEKSMYQHAQQLGVTMTELLEKERPSQEEGLDAFEFALYERGINPKRDKVERFYKTTDDSILFPEYINRNVRIGMVGLGKLDVVLDDIVSTTVNIDSATYETVKAEFDEKGDLDLSRVTEKGDFPTVSMKTGKEVIRLAKTGVKIEATYEVLRRMKLPVLSVHMQLIGKRLQKKKVAYAVYTLLNGDGNGNALTPTVDALNYDNLLDFMLSMENWEATVWFSKKDMLKNILTLTEFKDTRLFETAKTGALATPFGHDLKKFNWSESTLGDDQLYQLDKSAALELVKETGAELIETDKVIDRQFEKTVISEVCGFSKIYPDACKIFQKS